METKREKELRRALEMITQLPDQLSQPVDEWSEVEGYEWAISIARNVLDNDDKQKDKEKNPE